MKSLVRKKNIFTDNIDECACAIDRYAKKNHPVCWEEFNWKKNQVWHKASNYEASNEEGNHSPVEGTSLRKKILLRNWRWYKLKIFILRNQVWHKGLFFEERYHKITTETIILWRINTELKILLNFKVAVIPIFVWAVGMVPKSLENN